MTKHRPLLFVVDTHGNEPIGRLALQHAETKLALKVETLVGNPRAVAQRVRFVDIDLNRSFPGDAASPLYEVRRAADLVKLASPFHFVIDLHGATYHTGVFVIVTNPTTANMKLAAALPIERVVIWESSHPESNVPLTAAVPCGVEIEAGPDKDPSVVSQLSGILQQIITRGVDQPIADHKQTIFEVCGRLNRSELKNQTFTKLVDFEPVKLSDETFYPLLVGRYTDILCYKMRLLKSNS